jgi:hypothetical protein
MNSTRLCISFTLALVAGSLSGLLACDEGEPQADECAAFVDDEITDDWQVDFVNMRAEPVYVEADCRGQPFTLTDAQSQPVIFDGFGCECFCDDMMDPGVADCFDCAADCLGFSWVQRIEPGATWSVTVPGHLLVEAESTIPGSCVDQELEANQNCFSRRAAEPGTYTVRTATSSTLACSGQDCECTDVELGNCRTMGSLGDRVEFGATFEFPGAATIVFD